jgi:hypothetical protein
MDLQGQYKEVMQAKRQGVMHKQQLDRLTSLENSVISSMKQLVQFLDGKTTKTELVNHLKDYATTSDINKVVSALEQLDSRLTASKLDITPLTKGLSALEEQLKKLPTEYPESPEPVEEVTVKNQIDITPLEKAIKSLVLKAPDVNVSSPTVNVDAPDLKPLQESLLDVVKAINKQEFPKTDLSNVEKKLDESNKHLKQLVEKPVGGGGGGGGNGTPYVDSEGKAKYVILTVDGKIPVEAGATSTYESRNDTTTDTNLVYLGKALPGSDVTDAAWQIKRYDKSAGLMSFADDETTFTKQWSGRTTYGY